MILQDGRVEMLWTKFTDFTNLPGLSDLLAAIVSLFGSARRPRRSPSPKTASEVAPGRQELPLSMRLSLWSGWVGEQLACPKSLGWRAQTGDLASYLCP